MSSDEDLSLADDSEDELLSNANDNVSQNDMDDLFGDDAGDEDRPALVLVYTLSQTRVDFVSAQNALWMTRSLILATMRAEPIA